MDLDSQLPVWYKPISHSYLRRALWHDYKSPCNYMITLSKHPDQSNLSHLDTGMLTMPEPIYPKLLPTGMAISRAFKITIAKYPYIRLLKYVIMPDHMHFILSVTKETPEHLGFYINSIKSACTQENWMRNANCTICHVPVFAEGYNDRILTQANQLNNWFHYISENPKRLLIKQSYPEYFQHAQIQIKHDESHHIYGNHFLLSNPQRFWVKYSSAFSIKQKEEWRKRCIEEIEKESVIVSAFIHPEEKKILESAIASNGKIIQIVENPLLHKEKPEKKRFYLCAEGRFLIISLNQEIIKYDQHMTKPRAILLNELAKKITCVPNENLRIIH